LIIGGGAVSSSEKSCQNSVPIPGVEGHRPGAAPLGQLSPSRSLAHFGAVPDNRSLIQINPHILLLHCVHRSGRRPKDRSIWVNQYSAAEVQNVDIGRDYQGEAADQRSACARRHATREARESAQRTGGDRACARALQQGHAAKTDGLSQNAGYGNILRRCRALHRAYDVDWSRWLPSHACRVMAISRPAFSDRGEKALTIGPKLRHAE